jgi:hypothetical protein
LTERVGYRLAEYQVSTVQTEARTRLDLTESGCLNMTHAYSRLHSAGGAAAAFCIRSEPIDEQLINSFIIKKLFNQV